MRQSRTRSTVLLALVLVLLTNLGLGACSASDPGGSVSVLAIWTGDEGRAFKQVLNAFTAKTGIEVHYQGTRAASQVLLSDVQQGTPPDVAVLPSPAELATYMRGGDLRPLDDILDPLRNGAYSQQWLRLQRLGTDHRYVVPVKADLKSIIFYDPTHLPAPTPRTWEELVALGRRIVTAGGVPWCMGMGDPPSSGWPGTDWIQDILLHQSGTDAYRRWAAGALPWTSPQVRQAWTRWGTLVTGAGNVRGGATSALLTDFGDAGRPMFSHPQGCSLEHQGSFIMGSYQGFRRPNAANPRPGTDFDFFSFPGSGQGGAATAPVSRVSADLAGMFNDTPQARALMRYLATRQAQAIWPARRGASAFSANREVDQRVYGDPVSKRIAATLTSDDTLCFDASDVMPATMSNAFDRAVLEYLSNPGQLDALLAKLDKVRLGVQPEEWLHLPCGR